MDEQGCPRCKTTKYRNPSLKLLVNVCGHSLCESCVDLLFIKGSGACPECGTALRRTNFRLQIFEDSSVEKELDVRRRILRDFNKKEEDFVSLLEYNDYLEMVETIICNLTTGTEVENTKRKIDQYKKDNKDQIKKNMSKLSRDQEYLDMLIEEEKQQATTRRSLEEEQEALEKARKRKNKAALIDDLMFSERSAKDIVAAHRDSTSQMDTSSQPAAPTMFSTGIKIGHSDTVLPMSSKMEEGEMFVYEWVEIDNCGPKLMDVDDIHSRGYLSNVRPATDAERGGGFSSTIACQRALHDTVCGLFFFNQPISGQQAMVT